MSKFTKSVVALAATAAALGVGVASADAAISVNHNPTGSSDTLTATLSSPPSGATHYTLAQCNVTDVDAADWGRDCNADSAVGFTAVSTTSADVAVDKTFDDTSFVPGLSPQWTSTSCLGATGSQCAVVVSWYSLAAGPPVELGAEKANIAFP
jgi:hypothetical protein